MVGEFSRYARVTQPGVAVGGSIYMIVDNPLGVIPKLVIIRSVNSASEGRLDEALLSDFGLGVAAYINNGSPYQITMKMGTYSGSTASQTYYFNTDKIRVGIYPNHTWDENNDYNIDFYA